MMDVQGDVGLDGSGDETLPRLVALVDDLHGVLLILGLSGEGERVLGLAVWDYGQQLRQYEMRTRTKCWTNSCRS